MGSTARMCTRLRTWQVSSAGFWFLAILTLAGETTLAATPTLVPNSQRYRERNPSAATGRAGSSVLQIRALQSRTTGKTTLDVLARSHRLQHADAAGDVVRLQLKSFDADGEIAWVKNMNGLSGSRLELTLEEAVRGQALHVQANVQCVDGSRTNVVSVTEVVRYRPDVTIHHLDLPSDAQAGVPVDILAVVAEQNGDTGAQTDCVLEVDGAVVDQARQIWVDGGDMVTCAFTHTFTHAGVAEVRVSLTGTDPADDAPQNDSRTAQIQITEPSIPSVPSVRATVQGLLRGAWERVEIWLNGYPGDLDETHTAGWHEWCTYEVLRPGGIEFPVQVEVVEHSDGALVSSTFAEIASFSHEGQLESIAFWRNQTTGVTLKILLSHLTGTTTLRYERIRTEAVYLSDAYEDVWHGDSQQRGRYYLTQIASTSWIKGDAHSLTMRVLTPVEQLEFSNDLALSPVHHHIIRPPVCEDRGSEELPILVCTESEALIVGHLGTLP